MDARAARVSIIPRMNRALSGLNYRLPKALWGRRMPMQRKVFRIEEMLGGTAGASLSAAEADPSLRFDEIMAELKTLRAAMAAPREHAGESPAEAVPPQAGEVRKLKIELDVIGEAIPPTKNAISTLQEGA